MDEGRRHVDEFRPQIDVHLARFFDEGEVLGRNCSDGNIPYIDLLFPDQVEQQIERAFVLRDMKIEGERRHRLTR